MSRHPSQVPVYVLAPGGLKCFHRSFFRCETGRKPLVWIWTGFRILDLIERKDAVQILVSVLVDVVLQFPNVDYVDTDADNHAR